MKKLKYILLSLVLLFTVNVNAIETIKQPLYYHMYDYDLVWSDGGTQYMPLNFNNKSFYYFHKLNFNTHFNYNGQAYRLPNFSDVLTHEGHYKVTFSILSVDDNAFHTYVIPYIALGDNFTNCNIYHDALRSEEQTWLFQREYRVECDNVLYRKNKDVNNDAYIFKIIINPNIGERGLGTAISSSFTFTYKDTNNIVIEQNQNIINNQNQINDNLTNSDTTGANSKLNDLLQNKDTDHGGLSSIIKAPLVAINAMLSNTCTPLSATIYGKTISFPCGNDMWSKVGDFKVWYNTVIGGYILYNLIRKLFILVNDLKNPDEDRIRTVDL